MRDAPPSYHPWLAAWASAGGLCAAVQGVAGLLIYTVMLSPRSDGQPAGVIGRVTAALPCWLYVEFGKAALGMVLGVGLVATAPGLYWGSVRARRFALVYGTAAVPGHLAYLAFESFWVLPALYPNYAILPEDAVAAATGTRIAAVGFAGHAAILLVCLLRPAPTTPSPHLAPRPTAAAVDSLPRFPGS